MLNGLLFPFVFVFVSLTTNGENAPSFTDKISTSPADSIGVVAEGQTVIFTCKADGSGPNTYSYTSTNLNGTPRNLNLDARYTVHQDGRLVITNVQRGKDDGFYFCVAKNNHGAALSKRAKLHIAYLTIPSGSGSSVTMTATQYTGFKYTYSTADTFPEYPKTTYTWTLNSMSLVENERISVSDTGNLYIAYVQINDLGTYTSVVKNTVTSTQYTRPNLKLQLQHAAPSSTIKSSILLGPSDKVAVHNKQQTVTFECFATGKPMPTITWKKNNQVISSNSKYDIHNYKKRLIVKNIQSSDQGTYSCHVSNPKSAGAGTRTAALVVHVAPSWTRSPSNATAKVLNSVTFSCITAGSPTPQYTWYHNGVPVIQGSSARKSINANNNDLTISSMVDNDRGVVQCVAWNVAGHVIGTAYLTVDGVPVWIDVPPKDRTVMLGETVELPCQARGSVTPSINWQKDGKFIGFYASGSRFHLKSSGSLQITNTKKSDSALYMCIATTPSGYRNASATLKVLSKTNITTPLPSTIKAIKGHPKVLVVGVTHDQNVALTFTWTKDGATIVNSRIKVLANGSLYITRVQDSDTGDYKCVVYSIIGNGTTSGRMVVQETPLSPSRPVVVTIQSTSVRLTWDPPGYNGNSAIISYNVEYQKESDNWKLTLENINPSSKVSAVVTGLKPYTRYKFRVRAVNGVGVGLPSDATAFITTYAAPPSQAPSNVLGTPGSAESLLVQWKVPSANTHNGALQGFRIAYRQSGIQGSSFSIKQITNGLATQGTVTGLLRWTEYQIKVQAYNSAGAGPFSSAVLLMTGEGAPGAPVQNLKIVKINPSSVDLQWEPPPQKQWNGKLKHYKLQAWEPSTPNTVIEQTVNHDSSKSLQQGTLSNLKKYTQYELVVVAVNGAGDSPQSTKLLVKTEQGIPDAVSSLSISEVYSDGFLVSWRLPTQVNGKLVSYVVECWQNDSKSSTMKTYRVSDTTLAYVTTGLKPKTLYTVSVAAETQAGKGSARMLNVKTVDSPVPPGAPSKPQIVEARSWVVLLRWTPGFSGRAPIREYNIQYNNDSFYDPVTANWKTGLTVRDAHRVFQLFPVVLPNLRPNIGYRFRVIAINTAGNSPPSNVSDRVMTLETAPSLPPSDLTVHRRDNAGELEIRWKIPPKTSWNSDSIGYNIAFVPSSSSQHTLKIKVPNAYLTKYIVGGLLMYTKYRISIHAYNLNGKGQSNTSTEVYYTTSEGAPVQPPTNVRTKVLSSTAIQLNWGPVSEVGRNGKILGYKIFHRISGQTIEKVTRIQGAIYSFVISKLESFVIYEFEILAYTRHGLGPKSRPVRAKTLESIPDPPSRVRFSYVEKDSVKLLWDTPIYPHGNITGYRVAYRRNQSTGSFLYDDANLPASRRAEVVLGLYDKTHYRFYVWAKTIKGWGPSAQQVVYTTNDQEFPPDTPFIFPIPTESISERSVIVEWRINEYPRSPYRYFTFQFEANNGGWLYYSTNLDARLRKIKVEGLLPGTRYRFRIMATNDVGDSPYSSPSHEVTTNPTVPTGAPRDVRIKADSPTSLVVEWTAPIPAELGGTLQGFIIKYKKKDTWSFTTLAQLASNARNFVISGLDVFTTYYIIIAVVNEKGTGKFTPELPGTTGELAPSKGPTDVTRGSITKTSIIIKWKPPPLPSVNGYLQGFKVFFEGETPSHRRRRSVKSDCQINQSPNYIDVDHDKTEVTIRNLRKYVKYSIWVRAYNSKGVSPSSAVVIATTLPDVPGPIVSFSAVYVYNDRVELSWHKPCQPNGVLILYEIKYFKASSSIKSKLTLEPHKTSYILTGLAMLSEYTFQIRLKNHITYGPYSSFIARTKGPAVLPGTPRKPSVRATSDSAVISWQNGHSGNVPFTKFEIQSRIPGQGDFETHWTIQPRDLRKNKTFVSCTVGNLKPKTSYQFRIIAWNKVGKSPPSPASDIAPTGDGVIPPPLPLHQETWFIAVTAILGVILIIVVIGIAFICLRRRKENMAERLSTTGSSNRNTLELKDSRQSGSLPGLHIAYRDPAKEEDETDEVSSLGSKDGMSDPGAASEDENYPDKDANKLSFVNHYANNPNHQSWRTTYENQGDVPAKYDDEYKTQIVHLPEDDFVRPRFKSFSSLEEKDFPVPPPPAYESQAENDDMCFEKLPAESVTSFMSPEYEAMKTRSRGRPRSEMMRHAPSGSEEEVDGRRRPVYGSQNQIDQYPAPRRSRDDLKPSHRGSRDHFDSPEHKNPNIDGFSYATMPNQRVSSRNHDLYPSASQRPSDADVSSEVSSSSMRHAPSGSQEEVGRRRRPVYGSQDLIDQYPAPRRSRDDLKPSHRGSRDHFDSSEHKNPNIDGFSYATMPNQRVSSRNHDLYPSAFQRPSDADVSSEVSSSSNDQRDSRHHPRGPKPPRYPKPEFNREPGRRRNRPSNLHIPPNNYPENSTSSDSPTTSISPAPSYHSNYDDYETRYRTLPTRPPPPHGYGDENMEPEPIYQNTLPRREPMMVIQHGFSHGRLDDGEVQISPYQSFV